MAKKSDFNDILNAVEKNNTAGLDILQNYLGEYLKAYFLVGYDNNGDSVLILNGKNEQDFDSLESLVSRFSNVKFQPKLQEQITGNDEE